jgi:hypothetical protein
VNPRSGWYGRYPRYCGPCDFRRWLIAVSKAAAVIKAVVQAWLAAWEENDLFGRCRSLPAEPDPGSSLHRRHHPRDRPLAAQLWQARYHHHAHANRLLDSRGDIRRPDPTDGADRWPDLAPKGCDPEAEALYTAGAKNFSLRRHAVGIVADTQRRGGHLQAGEAGVRLRGSVGVCA